MRRASPAIVDGNEQNEQDGCISEQRGRYTRGQSRGPATRARARAVREALAAAEALAAVAVASAGGGGAVQEVSRGNLIMGSGFQFDMVPIVDVLNAS